MISLIIAISSLILILIIYASYLYIKYVKNKTINENITKTNHISPKNKNKPLMIIGPSGVGKSSTINCIIPEANMETGQISQKIERGKHTTRHSELFRLEKDTYIMDTPGFTSLYVTDVEKEQLRFYFPEFSEYEGTCRFQGCVHVHEPSCMVKEAVEKGVLSKERYENYQSFYAEIKDKKKKYK